MLGSRRFSVAAPRVWNNLPLDLKTDCNSLCGFKSRRTCTARTIFSQCHPAPPITVNQLELWRYINSTYLLTYLTVSNPTWPDLGTQIRSFWPLGLQNNMPDEWRQQCCQL